MSDGSKFVLQFSVEGSGQADLGKIASLVKEIQTVAGGHGGGLEAAAGHAGAMAGHLQSSKSAMMEFGLTAAVAGEAIEKVSEVGTGLMEMGAQVFEGIGKTFETLLEKGSEFESMILRLMGTGNRSREESLGMVKDAVKLTSQLPITESDAVRIMQTLATAKVDALKPIGETYEELAKKGKTVPGLEQMMGTEKFTKEGPRAITIIGDILAKTGQLGSGDSGMAIHELMGLIETGKLGSRMRFGALTDDLRKVGKSGHDAAGRIRELQKLLEEKGGLGLSQAAMSTFGGVMTNYKGLIDRITLAIMQPGEADGVMSHITKGFAEMYDVISGFFDESTPQGKEFLNTLREVGHFVADVLTAGMHALSDALSKVFQFIGDHPLLAKFAVGALMAGAAIAVVVGALITAIGVIGGVVLAVTMLSGVFEVALPIAIGLATGALIAFAGAAALGLAAYEAYEHDFAGVKTFFEDVKMVIDAVVEALGNWNGTTTSVSEETGKSLEKAGMLDTFLTLINYIQQAKTFWDEFSREFSERWGNISKTFGHAFEQLERVFDRVKHAAGQVLDVIFGNMDHGKDAVDEAGSAGAEWGDKLADFLQGIADFADSAAEYLEQAVSNVPDLIRQFADVYETVLNIKQGIMLMWYASSAAFKEMEAGVAAVMAVLMPMVDQLVAAARSANELKSGNYKTAAAIMDQGVKDAAADTKKYGALALQYNNEAGDAATKFAKEYDSHEAKEKSDALRKRADEYEDNPLKFGRKAPGTKLPTAAPTDPMLRHAAGLDPSNLPFNMQAASRTETHIRAELVVDGEVLAQKILKHVQEGLEKAGYHPGV